MTTLVEFSERPTSTMSEADLLTGYAGTATVVRCLCGGLIRSMNDERAIASAVRSHNRRSDHAAWAIENGWRYE